MGPPRSPDPHRAAAERTSVPRQNQAPASPFLYQHGSAVTRLARRHRAGEAAAATAVVLTRRRSKRCSTISTASWIVAVLLYGSGLRLEECLVTTSEGHDFAKVDPPEGKGTETASRCWLPPSRYRLLEHPDECAAFTGATCKPGWGGSDCRSHYRGNTRMPIASGVGSGSFRPPGSARIRGSVRRSATICMRAFLNGRSAKRGAAPVSRSRWVRTPCAIVLRRIYWRMATTFGPCRNCSATATSRRR